MNIINRIKIGIMALIAVMSLSVIIAPYFAHAAGEGVSGGLTDLKTSTPEVETLDIDAQGKEGIVQLIGKIINYALYISGAIAVLFIIIGGYQYLTSAGSDDGAKKGKTTVINALIGLVIIILAYVIVNVVVNFVTTT